MKNQKRIGYQFTILNLVALLLVGCSVFQSGEANPPDIVVPQDESEELPPPPIISDKLDDYFFPSNDLASEESVNSWETATPESAGWSQDGLNSIISFLQTPLPGSSVPAECGTNTTSFIILHKGRIVKEWYNPNVGSSEWSKCRLYAIDQKLPLTQAWTPETASDIYSSTKSIISTLVGILIDQGKIKSVEDSVSDYLGDHWTCFASEIQAGTLDPKYSLEQALVLEKEIKIKNLLDMTSGVGGSGKGDYGFYPYFVTEPGKVWFYNTNAYHQLFNVIAAAEGETPPKVNCQMPRADYVEKVFDLNIIAKRLLFDRIGMKHTSFNLNTAEWEKLKWVVSSSRDMARFGLLSLTQGKWRQNGKIETIFSTNNPYYLEAVRSSTPLPGQVPDPNYGNPSYGYLWWLNGKGEARLSGTDFQACFVYATTGVDIGAGRKPSGELPDDLNMCAAILPALIPSAPSDLYAALGGLDKKIYVVPSMDLVVIRHGGAADNFTLASTDFDELLWKAMMQSRASN